MTLLSGFPMINQNTTITEDGQPNKDAPLECVSTALLAGTMWLLGVSQVGGKFTPDYFKDQVYGEAYIGGTSASAYVAFLAQQFGVRLYSFSANNWDLVAQAHKELQAGHPVVFTEPDPYVRASLNWSHVCVWYAEETGLLTALDPYIGMAIQRTDDEWAKLLLDNQIWILERMSDEVPKTIDVTDPEVAHFFELATSDPSGNMWRCRSNGKILKDGMLSFYRKFGGDELCGLTYLGLPMSGEIPLDGEGNTRQNFELGVLLYDPKHKYDTRPGTSNPDTRPVYPAHLYDGGPGQDPRIVQLQQQLQAAQKQDSAPAALLTDMQSIKAIAGKY